MRLDRSPRRLHVLNGRRFRVSTRYAVPFLLVGAIVAAVLAGSVAAQPTTASSDTPDVQLPDLVVSALSNPPATVKPGGIFSLTDTTTNIGNASAVPSTTGYFLSEETTTDSG